MRNLILVLATLFFLSGCTSKDEEQFLNVYEKNKAYHLGLIKTEETTLKEGSATKALLTATYLFTETDDLNDTRDEKFIVGLYLDEDEGSFESDEYNLTLNGKSPKSIVTLAKNDSRLKGISFASDWTKFYLLTFPHTKSIRFKLLFSSDIYGKGELPFAKKAKYVFTKEAFK